MEKEQDLLKVGGPEFALRILYRQNASIQGEIQWLNTGKKTFFRSLFELVSLIQEALEETNETGDELPLRSWKECEKQSRETPGIDTP